MKNLIKRWLIKKLIHNHYPVMVPYKDHWIFIDTYYQKIWKIKYMARPDMPFSIELVEQ